jgi:hypothetical protein
MPSLTAHLRRPDNHAALPFHPSCPSCRLERLTGDLPREELISPRTQAAIAAGLLAFSGGAAPAAAVAAEPEQLSEGAAAPGATGGEASGTGQSDAGGETTELLEEPAPTEPAADAPPSEAAEPVATAPATDPQQSAPAGEPELPPPEPASTPGDDVQGETQQDDPGTRPNGDDEQRQPNDVPETQPRNQSRSQHHPGSQPKDDAKSKQNPGAQPKHGDNSEQNDPDVQSNNDAESNEQHPESPEAESQNPVASPRLDGPAAPRAPAAGSEVEPATSAEPAPVSAPAEPAQRYVGGSAQAAPETVRVAVSTGAGQGTGQQSADPVADSAEPGDRVHVVLRGESLWSIAADRLGDRATVARVAREVNRLWELNQSRIGTGDPDLIFAGTRLTLR